MIGEHIEPFIDDGESLVYFRFEIAKIKINNIDSLFDPPKARSYQLLDGVETIRQVGRFLLSGFLDHFGQP